MRPQMYRLTWFCMKNNWTFHKKNFQLAKMFRNHFAWRVIPINVYRWWLLFHFKLFVHYHLFLWTERKRYVLSTTVKWNGLNRMFVHTNKKKHHQNKVKIFAEFMFNCIYARRWRSAIKMNEKKHTKHPDRNVTMG